MGNKNARRRLSNIRPKEVSLVDEAANLRDFIVVKRKGKGKTKEELFKNENPNATVNSKVIGELNNLKKNVSEEQAKSIDEAISKLQTLSQELEKVSTDDKVTVKQTSGGSDMTKEEQDKMAELEKANKELSETNTTLTKDKDEKEKTEKADKEKAEKEKAEKEKADKEKTEKADKEKAEKEEKEKTEKAEKEKAEKEEEETKKSKERIDTLEKELADLKKSANPPSSEDDEDDDDVDVNKEIAHDGKEKIEKGFWGGTFL